MMADTQVEKLPISERLRNCVIGLHAEHDAVEVVVEAADIIDEIYAFAEQVESASSSGADTVNFLLELGRLGKLAAIVTAKVRGSPAMTAQSPNAGLDQAAEEYAYNPDTPTCRSGIRGETSVDPEEAFKAGARWQAALAPPQADHALVEALKLAREEILWLETGFHARRTEAALNKIDAALAAHPSLRETKDA